MGLYPRPGPVQLAAVHVLVLATGAAGLIYEVAWQRYLSRMLGSDTVATAVILATFLAGLAAGYLVCGRLTTQVTRHIRAYALLEAAIGAWGLAFPWLFGFVERATAGWSFAPPLGLVGEGLLCSLILTGLPTLCMGGTVPFLARGLSPGIEAATRVHARVYAVNTAGAFAGALAAGFWLVPELGLPGTVRAAAMLNLTAAVLLPLLPLGRSAAADCRQAQAPVRTQDRHAAGLLSGARRLSPVLLCLVGFLCGSYSMILENVLIRAANLACGSSAYAFSLVVAAFILCLAAGSFAIGRLRRVPDWLLPASLGLIALLLIPLFLSLDLWPYWAHRLRIAAPSTLPGFYQYWGSVFGTLTLLLLPAVGLMGATPTLLFHGLKGDLADVGRHSGQALGWNTAGNLVGSLAGGVGLYLVLDLPGVFLAAAAVAAVAAFLAARPLVRRPLVLLAALLAFLLALPPLSGTLERKRLAIGTFRLTMPTTGSLAGPAAFYAGFYPEAEILFRKDGPLVSVAVVEFPEHDWFPVRPRSILVNGKSDSSTVGDMYTIKLAAHLPALLARERREALVVGLGTGVTAGELTLYPEFARIDVAEISPTVVEALPYFRASTHDVAADPRVTILSEDALSVLARHDRKWDIIASEPSNPWVAGVDLLFTREFYHLVREHLRPGGLFLQWIHVFDASAGMLSMIAATLSAEFPHCRAFISQLNDLLILASVEPIGLDDLKRAEATLAGNARVRESLSPIRMDRIENILIREVWSPGFVARTFAGGAQQTMDYPRLHYMAGRSFFLGERVPRRLLLGPGTAAFSREYLLAQWRPGFPADPGELAELAASAVDLTKGEWARLLAADSLRLRAHLRDPGRFPLTLEQQHRLRPDLCRLAMRPGAGEAEWRAAGLGEADRQARARALFENSEEMLDWISAFPLDGLKALLTEGLERGDAAERAWCGEVVKRVEGWGRR